MWSSQDSAISNGLSADMWVDPRKLISWDLIRLMNISYFVPDGIIDPALAFDFIERFSRTIYLNLILVQDIKRESSFWYLDRSYETIHLGYNFHV